MRGGPAPWIQAVIEWSGTSATWTLTDTGSSTVLYTGPLLRYDMTTHPETIYRLMLADDSGNTQAFAYVAPPISAPVDLIATTATTAPDPPVEPDTEVWLKWMPLLGATNYEVLLDDTEFLTSTEPRLFLDDLEPDRTYAAQIRAYIDTATSLWSPLIYFTTERTAVADADEYEYEPAESRTFNDIQGWLPNGSMLVHGSGEPFGNENGVHTTVFRYSADSLASLRQLAGVRIVSAEVSLTRTLGYSDPRMVLSHWLLHNMSDFNAPPVMMPPAMGIDGGSAALGQQVWAQIPVGWVEAMISGVAAGLAWGGVTGRYMLAAPLSDPVLPRNGTLRITVG